VSIRTDVIITRQNRKFPLEAFQFTGTGKRDVTANVGGTVHSSLDLTEVQYDNKQKRM